MVKVKKHGLTALDIEATGEMAVRMVLANSEKLMARKARAIGVMARNSSEQH